MAAATVVMGLLAPRPCCPDDVPADVTVRALEPGDWAAVRRIYGEGIATGIATFETSVPSRASLDAKWLPEHRWVAEFDGQIVGWTAASPVSGRDCYSGVAETSVYVADGHRGRGVGKALLYKQVTAADQAGLWMLQTAIFTENRASIALHHAAGYRTVGIRERIPVQIDPHELPTVILTHRGLLRRVDVSTPSIRRGDHEERRPRSFITSGAWRSSGRSFPASIHPSRRRSSGIAPAALGNSVPSKSSS